MELGCLIQALQAVQTLGILLPQFNLANAIDVQKQPT